MKKQFISLAKTLERHPLRVGRGGLPTVIKADKVVATNRSRLVRLTHQPRIPFIEPIQHDGQIEGARITCTCGETIEIFFEYARE